MVFSDQRLLCKIARDIIPEEYTILIKDHPNSIQNPDMSFDHMAYQKYQYRRISFYQELANIKNTYLVDPLISMESIYKEYTSINCLLTSAGTAALGALKKNIPVIYFGSPWYKELKGVYYYRDIKDIKLIQKPSDAANGISLDKFSVEYMLPSVSELLNTYSEINSYTTNILVQILGELLP